MRARDVRAGGKRLAAFLEELTAPMGRRERRHWAEAYVRGLLLDGERKSVEPMAERLGAGAEGVQSLSPVRLPEPVGLFAGPGGHGRAGRPALARASGLGDRP